MNHNFITFRSITPAQRGQRLLQSSGIETKLMRTPRFMEEKGCGYCLRLKAVHTEQAMQLLTQAQIPFRAVYSALGGEGAGA